MIPSLSMDTGQQVAPPWKDPARPVDERVDLLVAEMTLDEKVGELGSRWFGNDMPNTGGAEDAAQESDTEGGETFNVAPLQDVFAAAGALSLEEASRHGLGHLTRIYGSVPITAGEGAAELVRQQRVVMESSRLGIPAIVHEECLTGFTTYGATVYPAAIAWGATFDPDLVERMAAAIGRDMAALGVHQGLSPVLDVVRDYRWGRVEETIGEDPYLVATLGAAYVRGLQSAGVLATLKHFAGYSASRGARNHGPVPMGRRELIDVILPPFETAITLAGARLGDELVLRRRRCAGGRRPLAADRSAPKPVGVHRNRRLRLLGRALPRHHASRRGRLRRGRRGRARGRHRRRTARHDRLRSRARGEGAARRTAGSRRRPRRPPGPHPEGRARPARSGLDAGGLDP